MISERRQVVALVAKLCLFAYLVLASYSIARPPIESMFLAAHHSQGLPAVWLAVAATALVAVAAMRRAVARWSLARVFVGAALASSTVLAALLMAHAAGVPGASFALYVWKDVYIVVLVELFWSITNVLSPVSRARWTYGLYCLAGSLGGASGNLLVAAASVRVGSATATWLVIPLLAAGSVACVAVGSGVTPSAAAPIDAAAGRDVVRRSRLLLVMLALVVVAQLTITLVDFEFNAVVEREITDVDTRTAAIGRVYAVVDLAAMLLQLASGALLSAIGVQATLVAVPLVLGVALGGVAAVPSFATVALSKVVSKSLDYSIFRVAKELCYVPLGYAEKTQGKATIDVLVYRLAKAGASLLLLGLAAARVTWLVVPIALGAVAVWTLLAVLLGRSHARLMTRS